MLFLALFDHTDTHVHGFGNVARLVVLIAVGADESLAVSGNTPRGNARSGERETPVIRISLHDVPVGWRLRNAEQRYIVPGVHKILVGKDKRGHLVFLREGECLLGKGICFLQGPGSQNDAGKITMPAVENEVQVTLFGAGGKPGCRTRPLCKMQHKGRFDHAGQTDSLGHEGKSAAGCSNESPRAGVPGAKGHVHHANLVFHLFDNNVVTLRIVRHVLQNARRGRHGIPAHVVAAGRERAEGYGVRAGQHHFAFRCIARRNLYAYRFDRGSRLVAFQESFTVFFADLVGLGGKMVVHEGRAFFGVNLQQSAYASGRDRICIQGAPRLFRDLCKGHVDHALVFDRGLVAENEGLIRNAAAQVRHRFGMKGNEQVDAVPEGGNPPGRNTDFGRVGAAPYPGHEFRGRVEMESVFFQK
ncbi:MAG: hypothetical protein BWY20_02244 [Spirochaetes bacterium ADurb.Bin215]|nr:MAG: hypothetical protein BWY20_02244 [Spirochaetes bacterium ADurb.Bin215]